jgi:hypothetical protein
VSPFVSDKNKFNHDIHLHEFSSSYITLQNCDESSTATKHVSFYNTTKSITNIIIHVMFKYCPINYVEKSAASHVRN